MTGEVLYNGEKLTKKLKRNIGYVLQVRAQELGCFAESRRSKFVRPDVSLLQMIWWAYRRGRLCLDEKSQHYGRQAAFWVARSCILSSLYQMFASLPFLGRSSNIPLYADFKRKRSFRAKRTPLW